MTADTRVHAAIVGADGTVLLGPIPTDLASLQGIVGGYLEVVHLGRDGTHAYCNEDGIEQRLPLNRVATAAMHTLSPAHETCALYGQVVFLGSTPDGDEDRITDLAVGVLAHGAAQHASAAPGWAGR